MTDYSDIKLIKYIIEFINSNDKFKNLFNHHKQIYPIDVLFEGLIYKLKSGLSYKNITNSWLNIKGGNLYYFHKKIIKYKIFEEFYNNYITKYVINMNEHLNEFYVDSTLVANKLGVDKVMHNIQLKKHKSCKISIIEDDFKIPIDYIISNSNIHDASLFCEHIHNISNKYPLLCTNKNKFIADSAYDSENIRNQLRETKLGILICDKNIRNNKDPNKIKKLKPTLHEKLLLKKRGVIEHTNNTLKQNRTVNIRYEKFSKHYENFVVLAIIRIAFKKIGIIENYNN
jgi:transposase